MQWLPSHSAGSTGSLRGPGLRTDTEPLLTCGEQMALVEPAEKCARDDGEEGREPKQQRGDRVQKSGFLSSLPLSPQRIR